MVVRRDVVSEMQRNLAGPPPDHWDATAKPVFQRRALFFMSRVAPALVILRPLPLRPPHRMAELPAAERFKPFGGKAAA